MRHTKNIPAVVSIPFHGDAIEAIQDKDGRIMVSLKRACESLGVDVDGQRRKLADYCWARTEIMSVRDAQGRPQKTLMIDCESLPSWLVTIHKNKVKASVRPLLEKFQKEAKNVLSAWFLGFSSDAPTMAKEIVEARRRADEAEAKLKQKQGFLNVALSQNRAANRDLKIASVKLNSLLRSTGKSGVDAEYMTVRDYCKEYGIKNGFGRSLNAAEIRVAGKGVSRLSRIHEVVIWPIYGAGGAVNAYRLDMLQGWKFMHDTALKTNPSQFQKSIGA